ncbi:MAG: hypothetical protein CO013_13130 [Syntrophobacterales bacterium CG_4_8_14_3_um_filter_58_8]|nr:MAG: hypothetical protein AUK26_02075 [Syntrophaceae bacterium CG2_30_58_14]PIV00436.1 MAG: hypothetical protein COS57_15945 [Syntrophobacterales bacterium CG03_land_8_20_14_0_80_58_14]PJC71722.1 MAG: hypothetical protein CO013_13130 [Syntrophobacterales bacterium CG_4_8_14_3_um_filter_58_8]
MITKTGETAVIAILCIGILGCGGLRFSEISPEARDFHPRRIAVLPADTTAFAEAKGVVDRLFAEVLIERQWFTGVAGGEAIGRRLESDEPFRKVVAGYLAKRTNVSFSDPELSGRIGELTGAEAFLLVRVDYWNYTTENDKKLAKVSLSITMVEAKTGKALWMASHHKISEYLIIKPDLPDVAKDLIREMIGYMPH